MHTFRMATQEMLTKWSTLTDDVQMHFPVKDKYLIVILKFAFDVQWPGIGLAPNSLQVASHKLNQL